MRTLMKFITFLLAGWFVRLSSWVEISAGGGLTEVAVVVSSAIMLKNKKSSLQSQLVKP